MRCLLVLLFSFCLITGTFAQVTFTKSNLPIITINTNGAVIQDEPKINAKMGIINNGPGAENKITDSPNDYNGNISIEYRGSSSQWFPKKPYGFETKDGEGVTTDVKLLGMPKENDWTLNATYNDKTLMRDGLAYIFAGSIMEYAPRVRYTELLVNGQYQGIYLLIEKIKRDNNRVDIAKMEATDNEGDALSGGYIIKIDKETGSNNGGWASLYKPYNNAWQNTFFQYDYPKTSDISQQQRIYIRSHMNTVENSIAGQDYKDPVKGYRKYIDTQSLMDYIIINELGKNPDAYRLSTYFYKERDSDGGMVKFGPVWDFNLGFGNVDYCTQGNPEGLVIQTFNDVCSEDGWVIHFWWKKFLDDEAFYNDLKKRWKTLRSKELSNERVNFVIDSISTMLGQAQVRNFQQWPVLGQYVWPHYYVGNTYAEEVSYLRNWMKNRLLYLDKVWEIKDSNSTDTTDNGITLFPNPTNESMTLGFTNSIPANIQIFVTNSTGQLLDVPQTISDKKSIKMETGHLSKGIYFVHLMDRSQKRYLKFMKL
ncbi:MAG: CotH kinase family protein [Saprospiraceae bacterium]|nr:CotH kinase family protein [Saprospiraceae bacterium]